MKRHLSVCLEMLLLTGKWPVPHQTLTQWSIQIVLKVKVKVKGHIRYPWQFYVFKIATPC